jgi:hypothetical protein
MIRTLLTFVIFAVLSLGTHSTFGDGKVMPPKNYKGSLEEKSQEAILIMRKPGYSESAVQDMILKISVEGEVKEFAWIIPLPNVPKIKKEDPGLFKELFDYVEYRNTRSKHGGKTSNAPAADNTASKSVEVIKRETVGDFDITTVRETDQGGLNPWLESEGFQTLEGSEDVLDFYREKNYVYACIKVSSEALASEKSIDSQPLRFTFETGGTDGIFFPMKLTGLQKDRFNVNLYIFYEAWLNDNLNEFGYKNRGMQLKYRDYDTQACKANAGKNYSVPEEDPFLKSAARKIPTVKKLFQKLYPGKRFYLTNIYANALDPAEVREWSDDLWLYPYYTDRSYVPLDARGPDFEEPKNSPKKLAGFFSWILIGSGVVVGLLVIGGVFIVFR